jgi:hypothetical protein
VKVQATSFHSTQRGGIRGFGDEEDRVEAHGLDRLGGSSAIDFPAVFISDHDFTEMATATGFLLLCRCLQTSSQRCTVLALSKVDDSVNLFLDLVGVDQ